MGIPVIRTSVISHLGGWQAIVNKRGWEQRHKDQLDSKVHGGTQDVKMPTSNS